MLDSAREKERSGGREREGRVEKLTRDRKFLSREKEEEERKGERERGEEEMKRERAGEREKRERGERKAFLLPPLLATEAISIARRREER